MRFVAEGAAGSLRVVDVGCGRGRYLRRLHQGGHEVVGVEENARQRDALAQEGFRVLAPGSPELKPEAFDVLLLSHVVEHMGPSDLAAFLAKYTSLLRPGGRLVVATPTLSPYFYDDFDHMRPYTPRAILMLLGEANAQLRFASSAAFSLEGLWFRRSPLEIRDCAARFLRGPAYWPLRLTDYAGAAIFFLSGGLLGRATGWVGLFRKGPHA